jgi:hypothetical protein
LGDLEGAELIRREVDGPHLLGARSESETCPAGTESIPAAVLESGIDRA